MKNYTPRVLEREEWGLLNGTPIADSLAKITDDKVTVLAVECDGEIVGAWAAAFYVGGEAGWIHDQHRSGEAASFLFAGMCSLAQRHGFTAFLSLIADPSIAAAVERNGARVLPGTLLSVPLDYDDSLANVTPVPGLH